MRNLSIALCFLFGCIFVTFNAIASDLFPSIVLNQASQYDGQEITVTGGVQDFKTKVSRRGNSYETFKLCDNKNCISVFAWGITTRTDGNEITVSGQFMKIKRVGQYTFFNELEIRQ